MGLFGIRDRIISVASLARSAELIAPKDKCNHPQSHTTAWQPQHLVAELATYSTLDEYYALAQGQATALSR